MKDTRRFSLSSESGVSCKLGISPSRKPGHWPPRVSFSPLTHRSRQGTIDYFSPELMDRYFGDYVHSLGISRNEFLALGRTRPDEGDFCMTVLALRFASRSNGVSQLHGQISRGMWQKLWPQVPIDEIPIGH